LRHLRFTTSARSLLPEPELLEILGRAFVRIHERAATIEGKARWADKNPENVRYTRQWEQLLGNEWLFVHVVRGPLDTLASMEEARFPLTLPADLNARIRVYTDYNRAGLEFGARFPERYVRIQYEALLADPVGEIDSLMSSLGERGEPQQISFHTIDHKTGLEDPKIRNFRGIDPSNTGKWNRLLSEEQARVILAATWELWAQLGGT